MNRPEDIELHPYGNGQGSFAPADPRGDTWAMLAHLSAFATLLIPFGHILGPLLIWLLKGREYPQVNRHGKEALNFQISISLYLLVSSLLVAVGIGLLLILGLIVFDFTMIVIASLRAREGREYQYPLTIRLIR